MQKRISSTFHSSGCEKHTDDSRSNFLSAEMCKTCENVGKTFAAVPGRTKEALEPILGKKFMGFSSGKLSNFERHKQK